MTSRVEAASLRPRTGIMQTGDPFAQVPPIWASERQPSNHQVVLFRRTFAVTETFTDTELTIFADTRYEVWLDDRLLGRGPARFSTYTHEYDQYQTGVLERGTHVLAVLVQWAPNSRRSESTVPYLQARLQGQTEQGRTDLVLTDRRWKALRSDAWREDAARVHEWNLIGPTELLDLRNLPPDWMLRAFSDRGWPAAVFQPTTVARVRPRSIPFLANVPMPVRVRESGALSPGWVIGELEPAETTQYTITFQARQATEFTMRILRPSGMALDTLVHLDDEPLSWEIDADSHPDILLSSREIEQGTHELSIVGPSPSGLTFAILADDLDLPSLPLRQGRHAGRRMLLADPVPQPEAVAITTTDGLDINFGDAPSYVVLELDRVVHGRLEMNATGTPGALLDSGWDERLWREWRPLPFPGSLHAEWNQTDSWAMDGAARSISTIDSRAGRYILLISWGGDPLLVDNLRVIEERYPVERRGSFQSGNRRLDRIWQVGVDTLYPNMLDAYADPWRERGQWWGDAFVADRVNQLVFGDTKLLWRGIDLMAEAVDDQGQPRVVAPNGGDNRMLDYAMLWIQSAADYYRQTGDASSISTIYLSLTRFMEYLSRQEHLETGLIDMPYGHWSQTVYIETRGYPNRAGQSTAVNALYYQALLNAAELADATARPRDAMHWKQKAGLVKERVNQLLYLPEAGRYATSRLPGDAEPPPPTPHAQAWPLAVGLVPDQEVDRVADALLELLSTDPSRPNVDIYGIYWVLEALGRAGRITEGVRIIERYYGHMLDRGATTWWERFDADLHYSVSLSHGWGGAPTWFLTTYGLGARRTGPMNWELRLPFERSRKISGTLPLAEGELSIQWNRQICAPSTLTLRAPDGGSGEFVMPNTSRAIVLSLDGSIVWQRGRAEADSAKLRDGSIVLTVPGGQHTVEVVEPCHTVSMPMSRR